ncbi:MAG: molybdopterin-dependent oxidoreductase [Candidatus Protistobacter heckmanni]|nr:molybdopterin-dependent oxidoreductase [Candidatus Protistobacter heckmanni]
MNHPVEQAQLDLPNRALEPIRLVVNGIRQEVDAHPSKRLSEMLRDDLGLIGTKVGCHAGDCGACTVLIDGHQACACITAAGQCAGAEVTTVEGLAKDGQLGRLQQAFLAHGAAQCGICTPGMLMAGMDVLRRHPDPTEQQVLDGLGGVLCRCTGYRKLVEAVLSVAGEAPAAEVTPAADSYPAGSLWLRTVRSPYQSARFVIGDVEALKRKHPGLVDVVTAADVPENSFSVFAVPKDQPVLADGRARFRGEAVLCLVGEAEAVQAIPESDIPIVWEPLPALETSEAALTATGDLIHDFAPENVLCRGRVVKGDIAKGFSASGFEAQDEYRTSFVEHAYIEPEAGYAEVFEEGGAKRIRLFACTQTPYMDRDEVARVLKLKPEQVHILPSAIGGGFGGKLDVSIQPLLAVVAWKLGRPVRTVYTRPESMISTTKRHPARIRARLACDAQGRLTAMDFHGDFNTGAYASWGSTVANRVPVHATGPYLVPHLRALTRAVYTNNSIGGAFRGFGIPQACIVSEALMDELAEKTGIDKLEFRRRNALVAGQPTATGQILSASVGIKACIEALEPAWKAANASAAAFNAAASAQASPMRRGVGVACMWYGIGNTVIANPSTMEGSLRRDGSFFLYNGAQEIGQGTATVIPQIFADALGVSIACVDQVMGDTDLTQDAGKSSASRQTFVSGNAAKFAGEHLRRQLCEMLGVTQNAVLSVEGATLIGAEGGARKTLDLASLPANELGDVAVGKGYFNPPTVPLDENGQGVSYATYGFAAQMAEVEVDTGLGSVKVLHIHAAHDCGRAVNPTQVEGQIHGGVAQSLGLALMEEYINGRTDNLHDYLISTVGDLPPITTYLIEDNEPLGPYGAKGVGEPALIATAPAILNAVHAATGVRVHQIPATPDRVRAAILAAGPQS